MLSFRDRFFTRKVSTAMTSPSAIVSAGGGAAAGIVIGGFAGPIGAAVGGVVGAVAAWAGRVAAAIPKAPEPTHIDPFTLSEPWRRLMQDSLSARRQFADAVRRTRSGPIRERLDGIGRRIDATVDEAWAAARAGHELADAAKRVDATGARRELDELTSRHEASGFDVTTQATIDALTAQLATADRMATMIQQTQAQLQLLNARLDEAVARCIELSVGAYQPDAFTAVEGDVGTITDELEALRGAIEETAALQRPAPSGGAAGTGR